MNVILDDKNLFKFFNNSCNVTERLITAVLVALSFLAIWGILAKSMVAAKEEDESSGIFCYFAESEAEAGEIAETIGAQLVAFEHGVAEVRADEDNLSDVGAEVEIYKEYIYTTYDTAVGGYIGSEQWYAEAVGLKEAWQYARGKDVLVAVIDSGIDTTHGELKGAVVDAVSVIPDEAYETYVGSLKFDASYKGPQDNLGHGTHVSGIIAAADDNYGCAGIAPESGILSIKALEKSGSSAKGLTSWVVAGIRLAIEQDADVINLSLGGSVKIDPMIQRAVDEAVLSGVTVVSAAGNISGMPMVYYPAACEGVIGVSALKERDDGLEFDDSYSNYGSLVDISAPGTDIYSTEPGGYGYRKGTSSAAPIVSGAAALLISIESGMSSDEVAGFLYDTAHDLGIEGRDDYYGNGSVDIAAAVKACSEKYTEVDKPSDSSESTGNSENNNVPESSSVQEDEKDSEDSVNDEGGNPPQLSGSDSLSLPVVTPEAEENVMYAMSNGTGQPKNSPEITEAGIKNTADTEISDKTEEVNKGTVETEAGNMAEAETGGMVYEKTASVTGQDTQSAAETDEESHNIQWKKPWMFILVIIIAAGLIIYLLKKRKNACENGRIKSKGEENVKDF